MTHCDTIECCVNYITNSRIAEIFVATDEVVQQLDSMAFHNLWLQYPEFSISQNEYCFTKLFRWLHIRTVNGLRFHGMVTPSVIIRYSVWLRTTVTRAREKEKPNQSRRVVMLYCAPSVVRQIFPTLKILISFILLLLSLPAFSGYIDAPYSGWYMSGSSLYIIHPDARDDSYTKYQSGYSDVSVGSYVCENLGKTDYTFSHFGRVTHEWWSGYYTSKKAIGCNKTNPTSPSVNARRG